jgi:hypothetical protein
MPVHQRTDAVRLFEPWGHGPGKLPDDGVSDDAPYSPSGPLLNFHHPGRRCVRSSKGAAFVVRELAGLAGSPPA